MSDPSTGIVVFILGAGASAGDDLKPIDGSKKGNSASPPLIKGFFNKRFYEAAEYTAAAANADYELAFDFITRTLLISEPVGTGRWEKLDLEQVFTSIELDREFDGPESDAGAQSILTRNVLIRYIGRMLSLSTLNKYGKHTRELSSRIQDRDSVITFNYDLLFDQELQRGHPEKRVAEGHYGNFFARVLRQPFLPDAGNLGVFLKMHGSLNWFQCTNLKCPGNADVQFETDAQAVLKNQTNRSPSRCTRCGAELIPLLIPPLVRKPVNENWILRGVWGLARHTLEIASSVVLVGFSAAETDFYARWLLRSSVGARSNVEVYVVDPMNEERAFRERMDNIFLRGWSPKFREFSEIRKILDEVGRPSLGSTAVPKT